MVNKPKAKAKRPGLNPAVAKRLRLLREQQEKEESDRQAELLAAEQRQAEEAERQKQLEIERQQQLEERKQKNDEKKERQRLAQIEQHKKRQTEQNLARLGFSIEDFPSINNQNPKSRKPFNRKKKTTNINNKVDTIEQPKDVSDVEDDWEALADDEEEVKPASDDYFESKKEEPHEEKEEEEQIEYKEPICCILGNVDAGKTSLIDKMKSTKVQKSEAGGITQKINTVILPFNANKFNVPGVILIDTPGHESFYSLRELGATLCNVVILLVDIMEGVKEQTIKSIDLVKSKRIPYVVALNKVDRVVNWESDSSVSIVKNLKKQANNTVLHFEELVRNIITQFAENGLNVELFNRNTDSRKYGSLFPLSAKTGEGIHDLMGGLIKLIATHRKADIIIKPTFKGILTDINIQKGIGKCLNVLVYDGYLNKQDTLVVGGMNGAYFKTITKMAVSTQPSKFQLVNDVKASTLTYITTKGDYETDYIIGSPVYTIPSTLTGKSKTDVEKVARKAIEVYLKKKDDEINKNKSRHGVLVYASTFGALMAITNHLDDIGVPYIDAKVKDVKSLDLQKVISMNNSEDSKIYNIIIAFDVHVDLKAHDMLKNNLDVSLIEDNIIYRVFEKLEETIETNKGNVSLKYKRMMSTPCILEILKGKEFIIARRDPIILGVKVMSGELVKNTILQVIRKKKIIILGRVTGIQSNNKDVEKGEVNQEVAVRIDNTEDTAKLYGRDFDNTDQLISQLSEHHRYIFTKHLYQDSSDNIQDAFDKLCQIYHYNKSNGIIDDYDSDDDW